MIVKVNRVKNINEIQRLKSEGVDIIGISVKLTKENLDTRALCIEEIQSIQKEFCIPSLSLNLNINEYCHEDIVRVSEILKPNSLNLFIEASSLINREKINENYLKTIKTINETELEIISFGNGFGYDGPCSIPDSFGIFTNLKYEEINIETLGTRSKYRIKNKKEWAKFLNIEKVDQNKLGDTILESITESMQERPYLVDDKNIYDVPIEKLIEIGALGISISINSLDEGEYAKEISNSNQIATMFNLEKVIEITKRIKNNGS